METESKREGRKKKALQLGFLTSHIKVQIEPLGPPYSVLKSFCKQQLDLTVCVGLSITASAQLTFRVSLVMEIMNLTHTVHTITHAHTKQQTLKMSDW